MIPNLLNTVTGIVLVYCAILAPAALNSRAWPMIAGGVLIGLLAMWARSGDKVKWFNVVNLALGGALLLLGLASTVIAIPFLVLFWWVFWVGIIVSIFALWSALYTRDRVAEA